MGYSMEFCSASISCNCHACNACRAFITETLIPEKVDDEPDSELNDTSNFGDTVRGWVDKIMDRGNKTEIEAVRPYLCPATSCRSICMTPSALCLDS